MRQAILLCPLIWLAIADPVIAQDSPATAPTPAAPATPAKPPPTEPPAEPSTAKPPQTEPPPAEPPPSKPPPAEPPATKPPPTEPPATKPPPAEQELIFQGEATSILGRQVHDPAGHVVGRIVDVLVSDTGQPRAAVIDFGGFMGVGN